MDAAGPVRPTGALAPVLLTITYLVLVHLSAVFGEPVLQWFALVLLCAIPQYALLRRGRLHNWLLLGLLAAMLLVLIRAGGGQYALYLPPVVLPGMLLLVFARSLAPGRIPLIVRVAEASAGPLGEERRKHCRQVTWAWVLMLGFQVIAAVLLAILGPLWLWSLMTNLVNYLLIGLMFVLEYVVRRLRFRGQPHPSLLQHLRTLARTRYT